MISQNEHAPKTKRVLRYSLRTLLVTTALAAIGITPFFRRKRTFDRIGLSNTPLSIVEFHEDVNFTAGWHRVAEMLGGKEWVFEIQSVVCLPFSMTQEQLNAIAGCPQLEQLAFAINNKHADLTFLKQLTNLRDLSVHLPSYGRDPKPRSPDHGSLADALLQLASLKTLVISTDSPGNGLVSYYCTEEEMQKAAAHLNQLQTIQIDAEVSDGYILAFKECPSLEQVAFHSPESTEEAFQAFVHQPNVRVLSIQESSVGVGGKYVFKFFDLDDGTVIVSLNERECILYRDERPDVTQEVTQVILATNPESVRTLQCEGDWCDLGYLISSGIHLPDAAIAFLNGGNVAETDTDINGFGVFPTNAYNP